jgi:hypothetical protein
VISGSASRAPASETAPPVERCFLRLPFAQTAAWQFLALCLHSGRAATHGTTEWHSVKLAQSDTSRPANCSAAEVMFVFVFCGPGDAEQASADSHSVSAARAGPGIREHQPRAPRLCHLGAGILSSQPSTAGANGSPTSTLAKAFQMLGQDLQAGSLSAAQQDPAKRAAGCGRSTQPPPSSRRRRVPANQRFAAGLQRSRPSFTSRQSVLCAAGIRQPAIKLSAGLPRTSGVRQ